MNGYPFGQNNSPVMMKETTMPEMRIKTALATFMNGLQKTATISQMGWKVVDCEAVLMVIVVEMKVVAEVADTEREEVDMEAENMKVGVEDVEMVD